MYLTQYYNELKSDMNNLSYWFPKIKDCGICVPKTVVVPVPEYVVKDLFLDNPEKSIDLCLSNIFSWISGMLVPTAKEYIKGLWFMKNGTFSNKFNFRNCLVSDDPYEITHNLAHINYVSSIFKTGGNTEVVIRERIPETSDGDVNVIPCIYNGMPLRNEYRVFYDFDNRKALYAVNYWDWDYCHKSISNNITDKIIYETMYPILIVDNELKKDDMLFLVEKHMKDVDMHGIWSVDIMLQKKSVGSNEYRPYLIDMATAATSAYWNPKKVTV